MLDISAWTESFVERMVNEKGSKPEYRFPSLSFISRVSIATSPSLSGDFETSVTTRLYCVIKWVAISLKFSKVSHKVLRSVSCKIGVGIVGGTTTGTVGVVGVSIGAMGIIGVVGVSTVGVVGVVGTITVGIVPVSTTGTVGIIIGCVGILVLLL